MILKESHQIYVIYFSVHQNFVYFKIIFLASDLELYHVDQIQKYYLRAILYLDTVKEQLNFFLLKLKSKYKYK